MNWSRQFLQLCPPQPPRPMTADEATFKEFCSALGLRCKTRFHNPSGRDDYPVGLEAKLEQIGCQPEDVEGYLQSEKHVLASLYLEAERPHPRSLKLRQLALRYALDARKPINDDGTRFKWNHTDDGLIITNMNSPTGGTKWNELTPASLAKARQGGTLRYSRKGKRILYLGQWILNWIAANEAAAERCGVEQQEGHDE